MVDHRIIAISLVAFAVVTFGCGELEHDVVGDGPLYFECQDSSECDSGFACAPNVVRLADGETGICVNSSVAGDTFSDTNCGPFLEFRASGVTGGGDAKCRLPFSCPLESGGEEVAGDSTVCPLGFICVPDDAGDCVACAFASCNMEPYGAVSATLTGIGNSGDGCLESGGGASPFTDAPGGRVYCALAPTTTYPSCPAGWTQLEALPNGCGTASGPFCAINVGVGSEFPAGSTAVINSSDRSIPAGPLMLTPVGSCESCRPSN